MSKAKSWETCAPGECKKLLNKLIKAELGKKNPKFGDYKEISNDGEIREWVENVVYKGNKPLLADFVGCVISCYPTSEKIITDVKNMVKIVKEGNGDDEWSKSVIEKCKSNYSEWINSVKFDNGEKRAKKCNAEEKKCLSQQEDQCVDKYVECTVGNKIDSTLSKWFGCHILQSKKEYLPLQEIKKNLIDTLETFVENVKKDPIEEDKVKKDPIEEDKIKKDPIKWEKCITEVCKNPLNKLIKAELDKKEPNFRDYKEIKNEDELKAWAENVVEQGDKDLLAEWFGCLIAQCSHSEKVTTDIIDMVKIVKKGEGNDEWLKCVTENCKERYDNWMKNFKLNKEGDKEKECDTQLKECLSQGEEDQCIHKYAECVIDGGKGKNFGKWIGCQVVKCNKYSQEIKQDIINTLETFVKGHHTIESISTDDLSFI